MLRAFRIALISAGALALAFTLAGEVGAQTPQRGGKLRVLFPMPLQTLDCHGLGAAALMVTLAPGYSTLLRFNPDDFPNIIGDLAKSWTVSNDRLTYTFKLTPGVTFHDGTALDSTDIKATYDRLRNPPQGVTSLRSSLYKAIDTIETPDPLTAVFKLSKPNPAMMLAFANPFGCIYSAEKLAENPKYPDTTIVGTGPFKLKEYISGASINYERFDKYFVSGLPYLDQISYTPAVGPAAVNALAGGQADAMFSQMSPAGRETVRAARGDKMTFPEGPYNVTNMLNVNITKPPLDDVRVRRALHLALDRRAGDAMMQKVWSSKGFGIAFAANVPFDMTDEQMAKLPGFGPDMEANRAEARRLLKEAGQENLKLTLLNRNAGDPYTSIAVFAIDQFRRIGVTVEQNLVETAPYYAGMAALKFDLAVDANVTVSSDPIEVFAKFLPDNPQNYTGAKDPVLQELYDKVSVETDLAKRRELSIAFERQLVDQAYILPLFRSIALAAVASNVHGWKIMPTTIVGIDQRNTWMNKE